MKDRLLICLPQKEKAFQACLLAASESSHAVNLMKYKSLQKRTLKLLLCFQLLRQNTSYSNTVPRKKKLNIIIYRMFRVKKFPLFEVLFPFPREWQGPQNKFKSKVNNNNKKTRQNMYFVKMLWHKLYADREPFFFFFECFSGAEIGSKSVFERHATIGSRSTFFPFNIPPR